MKEENYDKWLEAKSEVEHFDELDTYVKKMIYDIEQDFQDKWEVELEAVLLKKKNLMFRLIGYQKELERIQKEFGYSDDEAEERTKNTHRQIWRRIDVYLEAIGWTSSTLHFAGSGISENFDEWLELRKSVEHFNELTVDEKENLYEFEENHGCVLKEIMPEEKQMNFIGFDDESDYEDGFNPQPDKYRISKTVIFDGVDYTAHTRRGLRRIITDYKLVIKMYTKK